MTNQEPKRVLVVEDDATLAEVVGRYLECEGFEVRIEATGDRGLASALEWLPDLIVLDLMLPGLSGLDVCRRIREVAPIPVIMLTARSDENDRVLGLELGADDYVTKPFSPRELAARVRAVLRRSDDRTGAPREILRSADLELDPVSRKASRSGCQLLLTTKEFDLLAHFLRHPGRAFRRAELLEAIWGWTYGDTATITVHVRRLREKIEADPTNPQRLITVWGVGYRYDS